jgi:ABC-type multidrug transport system ATPase subunit
VLPLRLDGIRKRLGGRDLFAPVTLALPAGATAAVRGPNGAGKSTLLRIVATASRPTAGRVEVGGVDALRDPVAARRLLAWVPQEAPCYAELTPREHLAWWARLRRADAAGTAPLLEGSGLGPAADLPAGRLSRGQRQRLALAMGLVGDPVLLLLDEPFAALDEAGRAWLEGVLETRRGRGATLVALHQDPVRTDLTVRLEAP